MGFEELASELHKSAESEGRKLISASQKNAAKTVGEAQLKADELVMAAKKSVSAEIRQESAERLTSAKLSAKKMLDEARDEAVEACIHDVWKSFKASSLRKLAYPQLLQKLIADGLRELGTSEATVYVRDEDRQLVSGYRLAKLPAEYCGGAILESANGRIRVNKTLEEMFSQHKGGIRKQIYDKLF